MSTYEQEKESVVRFLEWDITEFKGTNHIVSDDGIMTKTNNYENY